MRIGGIVTLLALATMIIVMVRREKKKQPTAPASASA
jgi:hypothetical protein